ncbi:hypothetical protein FHS81_001928 [Pseudochelatococcus contaminans]|uniref:Uncharacterized protein n=1 Tax=Pseudochelatococcus contaminans TaxID=1538103 RepID=A0A7W6EH40_9HYPH|nr:hypothetical protein [Pseudochelatococcus contaminans]
MKMARKAHLHRMFSPAGKRIRKMARTITTKAKTILQVATIITSTTR